MPLQFTSQSHGPVAFGFFNIESDMLLLNELFFFADRFCAAVIELVDLPDDGHATARIPGWRISDPAAVGDLHGAIRGVNLTGFIGATYRAFPFPKAPEAFKQSPEGAQTQALIAEMITAFGTAAQIPVTLDRGADVFSLAEYELDGNGFAELIAYVDRGGYPGWRDEARPAYVEAMMATIARAR